MCGCRRLLQRDLLEQTADAESSAAVGVQRPRRGHKVQADHREVAEARLDVPGQVEAQEPLEVKGQVPRMGGGMREVLAERVRLLLPRRGHKE